MFTGCSRDESLAMFRVSSVADGIRQFALEESQMTTLKIFLVSRTRMICTTNFEVRNDS
jgi:hypothetical protein